MNDPRQAGRRHTVPANQRAPSNSTSTSTPSNFFPAQQGSRYESENKISQSLSPSSLVPSVTESGFGEPELSGQHTAGQDPASVDYSELAGFGFPPGGPLVWDWNNSMEFGEFSTFYEPQGELSQELRSQQPPSTDFSNPVPVRDESDHDIPNTPVTSSQSMTLASAASQAQVLDPSASRPPVPAAVMNTRAGTKRKAESDPSAPPSTTDTSPPKRLSMGKPLGPTAQQQVPRITRSQSAVQGEGSKDIDTPVTEDEPLQRSQSTSKKPAETALSTKDRKIAEVSSRLTTILPAGKVFPIQIGSELFRLSGASLSSDAPSYFSHYFGEQLIQTGGRASQVKTLYIDRDPLTFRDIALHLQGYFVKPRDEEHFVRLFADAQFYSLPRLTQQLFKSEIYIQVGDRHFQVPRDIFSSPGDSPNFFSLGFAHFFSTPSEVFPGLDRQTLLRPPSILPPCIPNRSGDVFADLLRLLQGYDVKIRDAAHRAELLRDARYFHLKGLEQRLLPCEISHNVLRGRSEILLRLDDLRQSGVSFSPDPDSPGVFRDSTAASKPATPLSTLEASNVPTGWIAYQRPFIDDDRYDLVLEISTSEATKLDVGAMRATFTGQTKARIASLFSVIANKLNLPAMMPLGLMMMQSGGGLAAQPASPANSGVSGERVRIKFDADAWVEVDGDVVVWDTGQDQSDGETDEEDDSQLPKVKKWKVGRELGKEMQWIVRKGQWRLRVEAAEDEPNKVEVALCAVRIEAHTDECWRNARRGFLI